MRLFVFYLSDRLVRVYMRRKIPMSAYNRVGYSWSEAKVTGICHDSRAANNHFLKASATNWNNFQNNDINTYCEHLIEHLQSITEMCIPNKVITIRPSDPPWITTSIKRHIRKRKRAYKGAKQTNLQIHWTKFRNLRNRVT